MRGKHGAVSVSEKLIRITPACAGKTEAYRYHAIRFEDHPRVCGENPHRRPNFIACAGSPPRVRGKLHTIRTKRTRKRITPACAGKTRNSNQFQEKHEDHPRVCGENVGILVYYVIPLGSPPRVRGKRKPVCILRTHPRITPACAGKTAVRVSLRRLARDHPRVCGENFSNSFTVNQ